MRTNSLPICRFGTVKLLNSNGSSVSSYSAIVTITNATLADKISLQPILPVNIKTIKGKGLFTLSDTVT